MTLDRALVKALLEINDGSGVGDVDGVQFDLRSALSDGGPTARNWIGDRVGLEHYLLPPDVFSPFPIKRIFSWPWDRPDWPALWAARMAAPRMQGIDPQSPRGRRIMFVGMARNAPDVAVVSGDTVFVEEVELEQIGHPLDPMEDRDQMIAWMAVRRSDGAVERTTRPMIYRRRSAFWGSSGAAIHTLVERVRQRSGLAHIDDGVVSDDSPLNWDEAALHRTQHALGRLKDLAERLAPLRQQWPDEFATQLQAMAGCFVAAGYALAKAEAERDVIPYAERALDVEAGSRRGSRTRMKAGDPVRAAALAVMTRNMSQGDCARRVADETGRTLRTVEHIISPMFEWRVLPGGAREKRPKAEFIAAKPT